MLNTQIAFRFCCEIGIFRIDGQRPNSSSFHSVVSLDQRFLDDGAKKFKLPTALLRSVLLQLRTLKCSLTATVLTSVASPNIVYKCIFPLCLHRHFHLHCPAHFGQVRAESCCTCRHDCPPHRSRSAQSQRL